MPHVAAIQSRYAGFSLLELLVVLSLLVAIAGIGVGVYDGIEEDELNALTRVELQRLASAVSRFHQDTGYWPRQGGICCDKDKSDQCDEDKPPVPCDWNHNGIFDWRVLITGTDDNGYEIRPWNTLTQTGWRGPYLGNKLLSNTPVKLGKRYLATGFDSGNTGDYGLDHRFRMDDLFALRYADDEKRIMDSVADQRAYALLSLNQRNVIIAAGPNGIHDSLPLPCSDCDAKDEPKAYEQICGHSDTGNLLQGDDMVICP